MSTIQLFSVLLDSYSSLDQSKSKCVHFSRTLGWFAVCNVITDILGRAGHWVVTDNGDTY